MKQVNITFEDSEHKVIEDAKKFHGGNWHDFFLDLGREYLKKKGGNE
ncbi:MAG TPA: hypothetical protein VMX17_15355 [Candidatus Glassbacteria bacterium]|nr:hypothetical protein [Candidatus Glassbacteria bacterium]